MTTTLENSYNKVLNKTTLSYWSCWSYISKSCWYNLQNISGVYVFTPSIATTLKTMSCFPASAQELLFKALPTKPCSAVTMESQIRLFQTLWWILIVLRVRVKAPSLLPSLTLSTRHSPHGSFCPSHTGLFAILQVGPLCSCFRLLRWLSLLPKMLFL